MGLSLYSLGLKSCQSHKNTLKTISMAGAIFFWPSAKYQKYGGFVGVHSSSVHIHCSPASMALADLSLKAVVSLRLKLLRTLTFQFSGHPSTPLPDWISRRVFKAWLHSQDLLLLVVSSLLAVTFRDACLTVFYREGWFFLGNYKFPSGIRSE